jgi:hypothetical protein
MTTENDIKLHIFGIRHHGPGSARSVLRALESVRPDVVLIEAPADAETTAREADVSTMTLPVAQVIYNTKALNEAIFLPFAAFSPEWQALCWAQKNGVKFRYMDLPFARTPQSRSDHSDQAFRALAGMDGYTDPERWWEARIERVAVSDPLGGFDVVMSLMRTLRELDDDTSEETTLREAWMRQTIRQARKEGFKRIAVVCGAWHTPALANTNRITASSDELLLKHLPRISSRCVWIPWSFERMTKASGYGAGVVAPAWYQLLWEHPETATVQWMARAARLLRDSDYHASAAQVLDAGRLADMTARLRGAHQPGIDELREAVMAVMGRGNAAVLDSISSDLITGSQLGHVPDMGLSLPLLEDFDAQIKRCRLKKETTKKQLSLDLREEGHRMKSQLLHRAGILGVPWGKMMDVGAKRHGGFHEHWELCWKPEFLLAIIEVAPLGNTVESATKTALLRQLQMAADIPALMEVLKSVLLADVPALLGGVLEAIQRESVEAHDMWTLLEATPTMVMARKYGAARQYDVFDIDVLLSTLIPRVCILLPVACVGLSEDAAEQHLSRIGVFNHAIGVLQAFTEQWYEALTSIASQKETSRLLAGMATRLLHDLEVYDATMLQQMLQYECSGPPMQTASWVRGFLNGSALLMLNYPGLWELLNNWMVSQEEETFIQTLPVLRRAFSDFSQAEREHMLAKAKKPHHTLTEMEEPKWSEALSVHVMPILEQILGPKTIIPDP